MSGADIMKRVTTRPHGPPHESSQHHLWSILIKRIKSESDRASSSDSNLQKIQGNLEYVEWHHRNAINKTRLRDIV